MTARASVGTALVVVAIAAVTLVIGAQRHATEGLAYTIVGLLLLTPMTLGCAAVGSIAWAGLRRRGNSEPGTEQARRALDRSGPPR